MSYSLLIYLVSYTISDHELLNFKKNYIQIFAFQFRFFYKRTVRLCAPENYLFSATETIRKACAMTMN